MRALWLGITALSLTAFADDLQSQPRRCRAQRYTIDPARTVVHFEVRSFGLFRQRGRFLTSTGSVSLDPQAAEGSFNVVIDARTIQARGAAILRVMRGTGFLNVESFPEISYKADRVVFYNRDPIRVEGELTLLGVTRQVPLRASGYHCTPAGDQNLRRCMMDATATFMRSEFGMTGSLSLAGDTVRLTIHAEGTTKPNDSE